MNFENGNLGMIRFFNGIKQCELCKNYRVQCVLESLHFNKMLTYYQIIRSMCKAQNFVCIRLKKMRMSKPIRIVLLVNNNFKIRKECNTKREKKHRLSDIEKKSAK